MKNKISRRVLARTIAEKLASEPSRQSYWIRALAAYLLEANQTDDADLVMNDIAHELFKQTGTLPVEVTSARPLSEQLQAELRKVLAEHTGAKKVSLETTVDPSLLGGFIARTPAQELDASVKSQLQQLATIK